MYSLGDTLEDFRDVDHVATTARCRLRTKLITRLVKGGAAHEWTYNNGRKASALFLAARNFRWDAILGLLEADVDVNASDEQGTTALMILLSNMPYEEQFPVQSGRPRMCFIYDNIQAFLDFGVELNAQDSTGKTALHHFFQAFAEWPYQQWTTDNAKDALEFLLEEGADPLIRDTNGVTAFEMAVKCKHIWAVKMMSTMCQSPRLDLKESFGGPREVERLFFATGCAHQYDPFHDDDNDDRPRDVGLNEHGFMPGDGDFDRPIDYWDAEGRFEASEAVSEALIKMLCDLDRSKFYTSDISFFISCLPPPNLVRVRSSRQHTMLMIARVLCSRGLDVSKLDSKQIKSLFKRLRRLREWDMVCELLDSVPDAEVDSVGDDGETLLFGILAHGNM
ncbi:ankyrin repeat-containing domain protein, partial [Apiosordaria backusii]